MNKNRLTLIVSTALSILVSFPRVLFMLSGNNNEAINSVIKITLEDTLIRFVLLFCFSFVTLRFNLVWIQNVKKRNKALLTVLVNAGILFTWAIFFYLINEFVYNIDSSVLSPVVNIVQYFFILGILLMSSFLINLIERSKQDAIEKEVLLQKSLQNELDALKSQINPHFLFNSLNTLSRLVRDDPDAADKFINKLSFLFRYILQSQEQTLVTVEEELKVLDSYVYLIKQRYKENFDITLELDHQIMQKKIPVLAMQMLVENAVKHNEISNHRPLLMEVYSEGNWIVGRNVLQQKNSYVESTNKGLYNLNAMIKIYCGKELEILKSATHFTVKIPTQ
jgi:two-component system, LytTR family, sensor kinase